jgi:hypothetical protein
MESGFVDAPVPIVPARHEAAVATWRHHVAAFVRDRPELLRKLPASVVQQGRAWPSPRSWEAAATMGAAAAAAGANAEVLKCLIEGIVGEGVGLEFLRFVRRSDLLDPEVVLADPTQFDPSVRSDLVLATVRSVVAAVADHRTEARWRAAWSVLDRVVAANRTDVAASCAMELMAIRSIEWGIPEGVKAFGSLLAEAASA